MCDEWQIIGNVEDEDGQMKMEDVELWRRDPVECIRELIGNPAFKNCLKYAPEQLFVDEEGAGRMYDEMWTGDWWWDTQVSARLLPSKL